MSQGREIRCYAYVYHLYAQVRDALIPDALAIVCTSTASGMIAVGSDGITCCVIRPIAVSTYSPAAPKATGSAASISNLQLAWLSSVSAFRNSVQDQGTLSIVNGNRKTES
jgi:hypothetical protein